MNCIYRDSHLLPSVLNRFYGVLVTQAGRTSTATRQERGMSRTKHISARLPPGRYSLLSGGKVRSFDIMDSFKGEGFEVCNQELEQKETSSSSKRQSVQRHEAITISEKAIEIKARSKTFLSAVFDGHAPEYSSTVYPEFCFTDSGSTFG